MKGIYCLDFETHTNKITNSEVILSCLTYGSGIKDYKQESLYGSNLIERTFNFIFLSTWQTSIEIYCHNLKYENYYIKDYLLSNGYKPLLPNQKFIEGEKTFKSLQDNRRVYSIEFYWEYKYKVGRQVVSCFKKLKFGCSLVLLGGLGVETIGNELKKRYPFITGKQVLTLGYNDYLGNEKELIDYCLMDTLIPFVKLWELFNSVPVKGLTAGSMGVNLLKKKWKERNGKNLFDFIDLKLNKNEWNDKYNFYHGGITFVNKFSYKTNIYENCKMIDITSAYPYAMTKPLPYLWLGEGFGEDLIDDKNPKLQDDTLYLYEVEVYEIKPKDKRMPDVIYDSRRKLNNNILGKNYLSSVELNYYKKIFDIKYEITFYTAYKSSCFLKEEIEELFELKRKAKEEKDEATEKTIKIVLNSLYGKFGQDWDREILLDCSLDYFLSLNVSNKYLYLREATSIGNHPRIIIKLKEEFVKKFSAIPIAVFITSYAREQLTMTANEIGWKDVFYGATDSLLFNDKDNNFRCDGKELGGWDLKKKYETFICCGQKFYFGIWFNEITKKFSLEQHISGIDFISYRENEDFNKIELFYVRRDVNGLGKLREENLIINNKEIKTFGDLKKLLLEEDILYWKRACSCTEQTPFGLIFKIEDREILIK